MSDDQQPVERIRHVFLDTQVIVAANFDFTEVSKLDRLASTCRAGAVGLHITDVVEEEVRNKIRERIAEIEKGVQALRNKADRLGGTRHPLQEVLEGVDSGNTVEELLRQFDDYLSRYEVDVIPTVDIPFLDILGQCHEGCPPFGEGKKKSEYPDAFSIEALRRWCRQTGETISIVSADEGFARACAENPAMSHVRALSHVLDLLFQFVQPTFAERATRVVEGSREGLELLIGKQFESLGFVLMDQDGDVESVRVLGVRLFDNSVVDVREDHVLIEIEAEVEFEALVHYGDYGSAVFDSEDRRPLYLRYAHHPVVRIVPIAVEVTLLVNSNDPSNPVIDGVSLSTRDVEVFADDWPY